MRTTKKGMVLVVSMILAISLTACGGTTDNQKQPDTAKKENISNEKEKKSSDKEADSQKEVEYFGKIKGLVGNEIEVDLAKNKAFDQAQQEAEEKGGDAGDGQMAATITSEASEGVAPVGSGTEGKADKMELDYTGEIKSFIIPAGAQILGLGGVEASMSDVKEGSVVFITTEGTPEAPVIVSIQILE